MGDQHAPDRSRRIEDRSEAAGDVRLAPAEQCKRQGIVEERKEQDGTPGSGGKAELFTLEIEIAPHRGGRDRQPQPDVGERRHVADGNADEEEGAAPDEGEYAE